MVSLHNFFKKAQGESYYDAVVIGKSSKLTPKHNKETWKVFSTAVREACSEQVIKRVERRYHFTIDENHEKPLLIRHVRAVQAVFVDPLRKDLYKESDTLTREQLIDLIPKKLPKEQPAHKIKGGVSMSSIREFFVTDLVLMDQKRLQLYAGIEKLKKHAYLQRLSMAIISHPLKKGMIIPAPDGMKRRDYYEIVHLGGKEGLEICALAPIAIDSKLKPVIVFQPTQLSLDKQGIFTLLNDFEKDPGSRGYIASRKIIKQVMKDSLFSKGDVTLTSYSMGGNHAQRLLKDYPGRFRRVVLFNDYSPGSDEPAEKYASIVNSKKWTKRCSLQIYRNVFIKNGVRYEDLTSGLGKKHVGHGVKNSHVKVKVTELHYETKNTTIQRRHIKRLLDCNPKKKHRVKKVVFSGEEVDKQLDNTKRGHKIGLLEKMRSLAASYFVHPLLDAVWSACQKILDLAMVILFGNDKDMPSNKT
ncbi:MAG: hypothetical protein V4494_06575 [Chlamydiota bacterium]